MVVIYLVPNGLRLKILPVVTVFQCGNQPRPQPNGRGLFPSVSSTVNQTRNIIDHFLTVLVSDRELEAQQPKLPLVRLAHIGLDERLRAVFGCGP